MKTCIWCLNPCEAYYKYVALAVKYMFDQDATEYRQQIAEKCENYKQR